MLLTLEEIRGKLDVIDTEVIRLLAERQSYMKTVGAHKRANGMPYLQPEREKEILRARIAQAVELGLDANLIEAILLAVFENSRKIQADES